MFRSIYDGYSRKITLTSIEPPRCDVFYILLLFRRGRPLRLLSAEWVQHSDSAKTNRICVFFRLVLCVHSIGHLVKCQMSLSFYRYCYLRDRTVPAHGLMLVPQSNRATKCPKKPTRCPAGETCSLWVGNKAYRIAVQKTHQDVCNYSSTVF